MKDKYFQQNIQFYLRKKSTLWKFANTIFALNDLILPMTRVTNQKQAFESNCI